MAHALGEVRPVGGVANRGGEHGEVGLAGVLVDHLAILLQGGAGAVDGGRRERAGGVDAVAEPRDGGSPHQFLDGARGIDVGDQEAGGVGADVDHRDARHARGW